MTLFSFCVVCAVISLLPCHLCIEPVTTTVGVLGGLALSAVYAGWEYTKCKRSECCTKDWLSLNYTELQRSLRKTLHGQHLVESLVARSIRGHINNNNPKKALTMSFNGWTGCGKNFVTKLIAQNLYCKGLDSQYVHLYISSQHFPNKGNLEEYKNRLRNDIKKYTQLCQYSLFIFDEMDKMPVGLIDVIKPYIDYYDNIDGIDYRRNIFIFLSNAGGKAIAKVAFQFWLDGKEREEITMKDVEYYIGKSIYNEKGGLQHSEIIQRHLIDVYVPFLPLEKKHVKLCVTDEFEARNIMYKNTVVDEIMEQLIYHPPEFQLYSQSGCKRVSQKIDVYVSDLFGDT